MRSLKITLVLLACTTILGACGLKGPLYLPGEDGQAPASQVPDDDDLTVTRKKDKQSGPG